MLMGTMPIGVIMQCHRAAHRWTDSTWSPSGVVACPRTHEAVALEAAGDHGDHGDGDIEQAWLIPGLVLELHRDEDDGYFENWAAPEPKVFVMWRMQDDRAQPVLASVSYGEGTRMLDSGENAAGVPMPPEVHAWLTAYLQANYRPAPRRGRQHG